MYTDTEKLSLSLSSAILTLEANQSDPYAHSLVQVFSHCKWVYSLLKRSKKGVGAGICILQFPEPP